MRLSIDVPEGRSFGNEKARGLAFNSDLVLSHLTVLSDKENEDDLVVVMVARGRRTEASRSIRDATLLALYKAMEVVQVTEP